MKNKSTFQFARHLMVIFSMTLFVDANLQGQTIQSLWSDFEVAISICDDCLEDFSMDFHQVEADELESEMNRIRRQLKDANASDLMSKSLKSQMDLVQTRILLNRLNFKQGSLIDETSINDLKFHLRDKLFRWKRYFKTLGTTWERVEDLPNREKQLLAEIGGLSNGRALNLNSFKSQLWPLFSTDLNQTIVKAEDFLYGYITKDQTWWAYEQFMSFAVYREGHYNRNITDAFDNIYTFLTMDGELITFNRFETYILDKKLNYWSEQFARLENTQAYQEDKQLAIAAASLLNTSQFVTPASLETFIEKAAIRRKGTAFLALQKLVKPFLSKGDFEEALKKTEPFREVFTQGKMNTQLGEKYHALIGLINLLNKQAGETSAVEISGINTSGDETQFIIQPTKLKHLAVVPRQNNRDILSYEFDGNRAWRLIDEIPYVGSNAYFFTNEIIRNGIEYIEHIPKRAVYSHPDVVGSFIGDDVQNFDFYFDFDRGIVLFASTSDYERFTKSEDTNDYIAPSSNASGVKSQFNSDSEGFHGRRYGNSNADLYVAFLEPGGRNWSKPHNLGQVVNTPFREQSPVLSTDGNTLYFSSEGHVGLGGLDNFKVPVKRIDKRLIITGKVENVSDVNSPFDDFYFREIGVKSDGTPNVLFSSNRKGNFDIYTIEKTNVRTANNPKSKKQSLENYFENYDYETQDYVPECCGDNFNLQLVCDTFENVKEITPPGKILVHGMVTDSEGNPLAHGRITFFTMLDSGKTSGPKPIQLNERSKGRYQVFLDAGKYYKITISGRTKDDDFTTEYLDDFVDLCENRDGNTYARKNYQTNAVKQLQQDNATTGFYFFFDTNVYAETLSDLEQIEAVYAIHFKKLRENPHLNLLLIGYADERGDISLNEELARRRGQYALGMFADWGYTSDQVRMIPIGETVRFDSDSLSKYSTLFKDSSVMYYDSQNQKWLLNRRVHIKFSVE
ncbi:MAG: hypothetical protein NXI23_26870 [Bacteroidetes bacterium]|nr:hypothetical protein [Bacteroidota bacterium]